MDDLVLILEAGNPSQGYARRKLLKAARDRWENHPSVEMAQWLSSCFREYRSSTSHDFFARSAALLAAGADPNGHVGGEPFLHLLAACGRSEFCLLHLAIDKFWPQLFWGSPGV